MRLHEDGALLLGHKLIAADPSSHSRLNLRDGVVPNPRLHHGLLELVEGHDLDDGVLPQGLDKVELELLAKADEYQIPYNKKCIDWQTLEDKICEFESLIKEADEMLIDWEEFGYDPIGIEQAIVDLSEQNFENQMVERVYGAGIEYYR